MWNRDHSLALSFFFTKFFFVLLGAALIFMPVLARAFAQHTGGGPQLALVIDITFYCCVPPACFLLVSLHRLLKNIGNQDIFIPQNVQMLRRISWCCMATSLLCLCASLFYLPFILVAAAAGFMGLILRVVKNVIQQAVAIKAENDYTI